MPVTIKNAEGIELMRIAGQILGRVHNEVAKELRAGMTTWDIDHLAEELIRSYGCIPSFLNYEGFPASVCVSVNDEVVHGIPSKKRILQEGDIVSLDMGVIYKGYQSDAARTYGIGTISKEAELLIERTKNSFFEGARMARAGGHLFDIGKAIEASIRPYGYGIVRDLCGHGIGRNMHEEPEIPNYRVMRRGMRLRAGMTLAIEPMINIGTYAVKWKKDGWTVVTRDGSLSAHYENTVLVTENGPEMLSLVEE
jgi:methionyl aminopeptidase